MQRSSSWSVSMHDERTGGILVGLEWSCESGGGNVSILPEPKITYFISLMRCGVRDNLSLARSMTSVIPPSGWNWGNEMQE